MANQLNRVNKIARDHIQKYFKELPRCVYQGDLNPSNLCIEENNHFKGIIDFNMFGTEVNANCFLNECMYYLKVSNFKDFSAQEIYKKMSSVQGCCLMKYSSIMS